MFFSLAFVAATLAQVAPQVTSPPTPPPLTEPAPTATPSPIPSAGTVPSPTPSGPVLTVSTNSVNLNPVQERTISVSGASPPLAATLDKKLVSVAVDSSSTSVTLTATQAIGSDVLHLVDANGARADVAVRVAFNAGTIVPQATLQVTGAPADPDWLARQVQSFVTRVTQALPGTQTKIGQVAAPSTPLAPGVQTQFSIPIEITDPTGATFDQTGTTVVNVQNLALDPFAPPLLFYDDDPEHVAGDGVLFRGTVANAQPTRLYYYHDATTDARRIAVVLTSASQDPASVQVIDATVGPNADVMHVGDAATRQFLVDKSHGEGIVVSLQQNQPYVLNDLPLPSRQLVAGTIDLRVLAGGPVVVTVIAYTPGVDPVTLANGPLLAGDGHHRTGVFSIAAFGNDTLAFTAGATDPKVVIGDREPTPASVDTNAPGHDYGDYGVLHAIDVTLINPGDAAVPAYLYFKPLAGISRATFLVDGSLVQLGCMRVPEPYQIAAYTIGPHQTMRSSVQTMTDGGSFYPVEIGVTQTAPQPSAPPITAPDGCFPKPGPTEAPSPEAPESPSPEASESPPPSPEPSP